MSEEAPEESMPSRSDRPEASAPTTSQTAIPSKVPDRPTPSRTRELRERLFGDDSSIFDPKNTDHVQAIVARSSAVQEESHHSDAPASPQPYLSTQDNAELVRVGRAAREALEAASLRRAAEKEGRAQQQGAPSTEIPVANEGPDPTPARPSRIDELRQKLFAYRCKDLGIINQAACARLFKVFAERGWRTAPFEEPESMKPELEEPRRFERLCYRALAEGVIGESRAAELLGISVRELDRRLDQVAA